MSAKNMNISVGGFRLSNLKSIRRASSKTQEQVARALDIPIGTYRNWEQEKNNPTPENLAALAMYFNCTVDDFMIVGREPNNSRLDMVDVPLFGSIAAGAPIEMIETDEYFPVPTQIVDKYPSAFLLKVQGESMNRVLPSGSYALVDPTGERIDGKVYALTVNGYDATIKRVKALANGFELIPDSTDSTYKSKIYDYGKEGTDIITIIGRVVWITFPFDYEI